MDNECREGVVGEITREDDIVQSTTIMKGAKKEEQ